MADQVQEEGECAVLKQLAVLILRVTRSSFTLKTWTDLDN